MQLICSDALTLQDSCTRPMHDSWPEGKGKKKYISIFILFKWCLIYIYFFYNLDSKMRICSFFGGVNFVCILTNSVWYDVIFFFLLFWFLLVYGFFINFWLLLLLLLSLLLLLCVFLLFSLLLLCCLLLYGFLLWLLLYVFPLFSLLL